VRPNKKETGIVGYFSEKREKFMVNDIYHFKVQLFFFLLTPFTEMPTGTVFPYLLRKRSPVRVVRFPDQNPGFCPF